MAVCKKQHEWDETANLQCPTCRAEWKAANPNYSKQHYLKNKERYQLRNKSEKSKQAAKRYYEKNKEKCKQNMKRWKEANPENKKKWYQENPDYRKEYAKRKRSTDSVFNFRCKIGNLIRQSFSRSKSWKKRSKVRDILGCDYETFHTHLIQSAKNNYGGKFFPKRPYEIDHMIPLSSAKTEADLISLNHFTNLQLLYKQDNRAKGAKLDWHFKPQNGNGTEHTLNS